MGRVTRRALMIVVGLSVLAVYGAGAVLGYVLLGWLLANPPDPFVLVTGVAIAILIGGYLSYRFGSARLLAGVDATDLPHQRAPALYRRLDRLCREIAVDEPRLLVADLGAPNALSVGGPRGSAIVLDRQLLGLLTIDELEGILAHELAHVERRDAFLQTLVVSAIRTLAGLLFVLFIPLTLLAMGVARAIAWLSGRPTDPPRGVPALVMLGIELLVGAILSVLTLVVLAHSRRREYAADERAADVTGRPAVLARGLVKIHRASRPDWSLRSLLTISGREGEDEGLRRLFSTHPPVEERVDRLLDGVEWRTAPSALGRRWG